MHNHTRKCETSTCASRMLVQANTRTCEARICANGVQKQHTYMMHGLIMHSHTPRNPCIYIRCLVQAPLQQTRCRHMLQHALRQPKWWGVCCTHTKMCTCTKTYIYIYICMSDDACQFLNHNRNKIVKSYTPTYLNTCHAHK